MKSRESLICVSCPMGCHLEIDVLEEGDWVITGNLCQRGIDYAKAELTNPTRVLTSTVRINNGFLNRVPVKTTMAIPKPLLFETMKIINNITLEAPVKMGDIIVANVLDTGADIVTSRSMGLK